MSTLRNGNRHTPDESKLPEVLRQVPWRKSEKSSDIEVRDGMSLLVAVPISNDSERPENGWYYELSVIDVDCDEHYLSLTCQDEQWVWDLDDVDWYVVLSTSFSH